MQTCTQTHHFEIKNANIFLGVGYPSPDLPRPHPPQHLQCLDLLRTYGAQAQRDNPRKKMLVTALSITNLALKW